MSSAAALVRVTTASVSPEIVVREEAPAVVDAEPHIDLTTDDLLFLVNRIGGKRPVGLDDAEEPEPPAAVREWLDAAAERHLRARGILDDSGRTNSAVAEMLSTTGTPGLIVNVSTQRGSIVETAVVAAVPDLAVIHEPLASGVHRLTPVATVDVVDRVAQLTSLTGAASAVSGPSSSLVIDLASLDAVTSAAAEDGAPEAEDVAGESGLTPEAASRLSQLVKNRRATHLVTVMHRSPELHMGVVTWWDAGIAGMWRVETVESDSGEQLSLSSCDMETLTAAIRSHLPGVLSSAS